MHKKRISFDVNQVIVCEHNNFVRENSVLLWYPEPESGAMSLSVGDNTDITIAPFSNRLTYTESETRTLHKVIKLNETLEDCFLLVLRDASTRVLTIEIDTTVLLMVTHFDMSRLGIFHGIGGEVCEYLLDAPLVEYGWEGSVGVVFDEGDASISNTLFQCIADVIKYLGEVTWCGFDGESLSNAG